ncbi:hypothetical protein [uncultured Bradyrhizobium sp.]|uniref:hypothetical protein n=1 Tax=uncultured Bradyrhizobium sp. TaxID=199684 RepID=UPI0035C97DC9
MKTLFAIAMSAAVLASWSAHAETTVSTVSTSCKSSAYGPSKCTTTTTTGSGSESTNQRQMSIVEERIYREEKEARIRKWEEFCKPTSFIDDMGITRLRYAKAGCDLGRSGEGSGPVAEMR